MGAILASDKICQTDPNWVPYLLSTHRGIIICVKENLRSSQLVWVQTTLYLKRTSSTSLKRFVETYDLWWRFLASNTCEFCPWTVLQLGLVDGYRVEGCKGGEDD